MSKAEEAINAVHAAIDRWNDDKAAGVSGMWRMDRFCKECTPEVLSTILASHAALREALKPFAHGCAVAQGQVIGLMTEDFERARAALNDTKGG